MQILTLFINHAANPIKARLNKIVSGVSEYQVRDILPGQEVPTADGWAFVHAYVPENHYAQVNIVSSTDGQSRWYNIWGPYNITNDNKKKIILTIFRPSSSGRHADVEQIT